MKILMIDNFDSFTYNLVDEFRKEGAALLIYRNDISKQQLDQILEDYAPKLIVLSPGPSTPKEAGICNHLIKTYYTSYPLFGICLGYQCMIETFEGEVEKAPYPVHGKKSHVYYKNTPLFDGLPNPFYAGRYHSLHGLKIPSFFDITAKTEEVVMAVENRKYHMYGLQFHPESILTTHGNRIIKNILEIVQ